MERERVPGRRRTSQPSHRSTVWIILFLLVGVHLSGAGVKLAHAQNINVGVGTNNPDLSALLELQSTAKGFLIPRLSNTQMNAVASPATGLIVYNTTYVNFYYWTGSAWVPLVGSGWALTGDAGTSASTNYLGTQDAQDVVQKTNARERMRIFSTGDVGLTSNWNVAQQIQFYEPSGVGTAYTSFRAKAQSANVSYRLPLSDGGTNYALITDGAGNLSWKVFATIGGGGSVPLWQRGGGQRTLEGLGSGNQASGKYSIATGFGNKASGQFSMVYGNNNWGSGQEALVGGGESNKAAGDHSSVCGGYNNTATGNNTTITGGSNNSTSGTHGAVLGGDNNSVSGNQSVIINGSGNSTSGVNNYVFGVNVTVAGSNTIVFRPTAPPTTKLGIGNTSPSEALDVTGNVRFSGALKPNGSTGSSGNYLLSAGSSSSPTWGTISIPTTNWGLNGNTGSNPAINYLGTADAQPLAIRTNNTERMRILSTGQIGVGTTSPTSQLQVVSTSTTDEVAAVYANAAGSSASQSIAAWGRTNGSGSSNTGTISALANGNGNTSAGTTNVALQINDGEFTMGRTTQGPSKGTVVGSATSGTLYTDQGPSGVVELSLQTDLATLAPTAGVYQDLGTFTINNRYATASSLILANVLAKTNGGGSPDPKLAVFTIDIESRASGSFVVHVGMIPTATDANSYQGSDMIRIGYTIINPGK